MPRSYAAAGDQTVTSSYLSVLGLTSATTIRPEVIGISWGATGTPVDKALVWLIQRYTAAGTATSVTPSKRDPGDPAATATAGSNHTSEPTYTSGELPHPIKGMHEKNSYEWFVYGGHGIKLPATANNGLGIQVKGSGYTEDVVAGFIWEE